MEISYLFGGSDKLDINLVAEKIREVLGAELLLVEGGGALNGSFMEAGLIDEMSLLLAPAADDSTKTPILFETGSYLAQNDTNTTEDTNDETIGQNMETVGTESSSEDGSILIAYFSRVDEVLTVAQAEGDENARPELASHVEHMEDYKVVFLGYPKMEYGFNCVSCI